MKYFVDFEATQFSHEIISVGCVREDGETFYSLVKPSKMKSMTSFITELTGITKEMLQDARNSDEVFSDFFDWISQDTDVVDFYCYGTSDIDFLKKNLKDRTTTFKSQAALSILAMKLIDYSGVVKDHFGLINNISLKKVMHYFYPSEEVEWHNALADAEMLCKVYTKINEGEPIKGTPFPEHMAPPKIVDSIDFDKYILYRDNKAYESMKEAVDDIVWILLGNGQKDFTIERIENRIIKAVRNKTKYFDFKWSVKIRPSED